MERREFLKNSSLGFGSLAVASAIAAPAASGEPGESTQTSASYTIREWDPVWAENYLKMATNPWENGVLDIKSIELLCVGLNAACTNLQPEPTRRHIRAALNAGASRDELMAVLKMAALAWLKSHCSSAPRRRTWPL